MPSFDVVSELDLMEVDNAVNQAAKEIGQRFDFKGGKSEITLEKEAKRIKIMADDEMKLRSIHQILQTKMAKRDLDLRGLTYGKEEQASGGIIRQSIELKAGISREEAKKITKQVKDSGLKLSTEIQGEQVRVIGKKLDDLQAMMTNLRSAELEFPVHFINMRS